MGRQWLARDELLDDAGSDPSDPGGIAPVIAKGELVEVSLQVLLAHGARIAKQPALQKRPVQYRLSSPCMPAA